MSATCTCGHPWHYRYQCGVVSCKCQEEEPTEAEQLRARVAELTEIAREWRDDPDGDAVMALSRIVDLVEALAKEVE